MSTPESGAPVSAELVLSQLERLLASPQFSGSERLSAFLKFAVENALRNQPERLKEAAIAREIFGRETYDGNLDSVVRGTARRLRERLDEYYERANGRESVRITIPKGAYVPVFSFLSTAVTPVSPAPQGVSPAFRLVAHAGLMAAGVVCCALLGYWAFHRQAQSPGSRMPAIAVLPFRDPSGDQGLGYSIRDDLTTRMAHMERVRVASRISMEKVVKDHLDVLSWARKFGLTAVLEGKISTAGERVEITADLTDVRTGYLFWTQTFDCLRSQIPMTDRLISEQAARALGLRQATLSRVPESASYDLYYRGRYMWENGDVREAVPLLEQAVAADRNFTLAEVALSESYSSLVQRGLKPAWQVLPMAERAARLALQTDPELGEAHAALGFLRYCQWRWSEADQEFRLATQLAPNDSTAWRQWAYVDFAYGRFSDAKQAFERAEIMEPGSLVSARGLAQIYYYWRRYDVAIAFSQRLLKLDPGDFIAHMVIADSLVQTARPKEALAEWRRMLDARPDNRDVKTRLAVYQAANGDVAPLQRIIVESQKTTTYVSPWVTAWYSMHLGDVRAALKLLDQAADERDSDVISVQWDPIFDGVRHEETYRRVLKKIGF
jgi:tetratricopeptide (TPR) repeat protein/TolB-like protein